MNEELKLKYEAVIDEKLDEVAGMDANTEEFGDAVRAISVLMDDVHKAEDLESQDLDRREKRTMENREAIQRKRESNRNLGLKIAGIVIPTGVQLGMFLKMLDFEKAGMVTTQVGRSLVSGIGKHLKIGI